MAARIAEQRHHVLGRRGEDQSHHPGRKRADMPWRCLYSGFFRDLRIERIYEGSDEMNLSGIARNLFKQHLLPGQVN